ncbi:MAG: DNA repair protein RecO [Lachnospiraceae bacterium]|nr:DNA repair protein RecO [Lachnospiraceae bacterium]
MGKIINVSGIVLSAMPIGEKDKRIVILTREFGKIAVFARGAKRQGSALLAAAHPFVFGTFSLIQGKSSYHLTQASVKNYFMELTRKQPGIYYGFYFLEFADYYGKEEIEGTEMLHLLYLSLKALLNPSLEDRLVRRIYELRMMTINGEYALDDKAMSPLAFYICQYIMGAPMKKLYTFTVTTQVLKELENLMNRHIKKVLDRKIKSLSILESFL